jgi:hypothetical protein
MCGECNWPQKKEEIEQTIGIITNDAWIRNLYYLEKHNEKEDSARKSTQSVEKS